MSLSATAARVPQVGRSVAGATLVTRGLALRRSALAAALASACVTVPVATFAAAGASSSSGTVPVAVPNAPSDPESRSDEAGATSGTVSAPVRDGAGTSFPGPAIDADAPASSSRRRNFFELGLAVRVENDPRERDDPDDEVPSGLSLAVSGALYFGRFFIESLGGDFGPLNPDGLNVGVTLAERDALTVDLLLVSVAGIAGDSEEGDLATADGEVDRDAYLLERGTLAIGTGLRVARYAGDWINQLRIVRTFPVVTDDGGIDASLRVGRQWPARQWLLRGIVGLNYVSSATNQAIWGVGVDEATSRFPRHDADGGVDVDLELGAARPLARDWVFRSTLRVRALSAAVRDSPLADDGFQAGLVAGINYVF